MLIHRNFGTCLARWVVAGQLASAALCACAAVAVAEPEPHQPPEPGAASPPSAVLLPPSAVLLPPSVPVDPVSAQPTGPGALAGVPELTRAADVSTLLGQNPTPAAPGAGPGAVVPTLNALNNAYLLPLNDMPSAPGEGSTLGVAPGDENADVSKRGYLKRLWAQYQRGDFEGTLLGKRPAGEPVGPGQILPPVAPLSGQ